MSYHINRLTVVFNNQLSTQVLHIPLREAFFSQSSAFCHGPAEVELMVYSHADVDRRAHVEAVDKILTMLARIPGVARRLRAAGVEMQIIGKGQQVTDLPQYRHMKGVPDPYFDGQTWDERARGFGDLKFSCGEENLLRLKQDRYYGRDICVHEFAHVIFNHGMTADTRRRFEDRYQAALDQGLWKGSYAATNADEFFAEMSMWYFGTQGDTGMAGQKPQRGSAGLRKYDRATWNMMDDFYAGRMENAPRAAALYVFK